MIIVLIYVIIVFKNVQIKHSIGFNGIDLIFNVIKI